MSEKIYGGVRDRISKGIENFRDFLGKKLTPESRGRMLISEIESAIYNEDYDRANELVNEIEKFVKDTDKLFEAAIQSRLRGWYDVEAGWWKNTVNFLIDQLKDSEKKKNARMQLQDVVSRRRANKGLPEPEEVAQTRLGEDIQSIHDSAQSQEEREQTIVNTVIQYARAELTFSDAVSAIEENISNPTLRDDAFVEIASIQINRSTQKQLQTGYGEFGGRGWKETATVTIPEAQWKLIETHMKERVSATRAEEWWIAVVSQIKFSHEDLQRALSHIADTKTKERLVQESAYRFADDIDVKSGFLTELEKYTQGMKTSDEKDQIYAFAVWRFITKHRYADFEASKAWASSIDLYFKRIQSQKVKDETALKIVEHFQGSGQYRSGKNGKEIINRARNVAEILVDGMQDAEMKGKAQAILNEKSKKKGIR